VLGVRALRKTLRWHRPTAAGRTSAFSGCSRHKPRSVAPVEADQSRRSSR
jgi:hypothetical protein